MGIGMGLALLLLLLLLLLLFLSFVVAAFLLNFYAILLTGSIISIACSVNRRRRDAEASSIAATATAGSGQAPENGDPNTKEPSKHTTPNNFQVKLTPNCAERDREKERGREKGKTRKVASQRHRASSFAIVRHALKQLLSHLLEQQQQLDS